MAKIDCTFIFIPVVKDYIGKALETLYKFTPINFRVIVVDQTKDGCYGLVHNYADLIIRNPRRINMGFSKANNEAILHALHWGSEYVACCNDDVEFLDSRYWQGLMDQFVAYPEMFAVCPASPIEPGWGYGLGSDGKWIIGNQCPDWGIQVKENIYPKAPDGSPITLEMARTPKGYDMLLAHRQGHIEGFAGWFVVFKRETLKKVGLYNERFGPGGGEDYEYVHRIYLAGGRASATMRSFVWHWWSKSREGLHTRNDIVPYIHKTFQDTNALFEYSSIGVNSPIYPPRENEPFGNKRKLKTEEIFVDDPR
ncbi:MAG: glycosyltransferase [Actinomycetota bacterium]